MFNLGKTKSLVGLDIGSSSVKAVELKKTRRATSWSVSASRPLAQDTVVDGAIMDAPSVAEKIISIFDNQKIKTKDVATSVSGHSVIVKRVSMPLMTEEELFDRVQAEASQHIPFDIADVNLSHQLLEATENQMDVLSGGREERQDSEPHQRSGASGEDARGRGHRRLRPAELLRSQLRTRSLASGRAAERRRQRDEHQHRPRLDSACSRATFPWAATSTPTRCRRNWT